MDLLDYPVLTFVVTFVVLWFAAWAGGLLGERWRRLTADARPDFDVVLGASLTLLGLVIGFSFSMAIGRYEMRNDHEGAEANAIKTAYLRADLLPQEDGIRVRALLRQYTDLRIQFYTTGDQQELGADRGGHYPSTESALGRRQPTGGGTANAYVIACHLERE